MIADNISKMLTVLHGALPVVTTPDGPGFWLDNVAGYFGLSMQGLERRCESRGAPIPLVYARRPSGRMSRVLLVDDTPDVLHHLHSGARHKRPPRAPRPIATLARNPHRLRAPLISPPGVAGRYYLLRDVARAYGIVYTTLRRRMASSKLDDIVFVVPAPRGAGYLAVAHTDMGRVHAALANVTLSPIAAQAAFERAQAGAYTPHTPGEKNAAGVDLVAPGGITPGTNPLTGEPDEAILDLVSSIEAGLASLGSAT